MYINKYTSVLCTDTQPWIYVYPYMVRIKIIVMKVEYKRKSGRKGCNKNPAPMNEIHRMKVLYACP